MLWFRIQNDTISSQLEFSWLSTKYHIPEVCNVWDYGKQNQLNPLQLWTWILFLTGTMKAYAILAVLLGIISGKSLLVHSEMATHHWRNVLFWCVVSLAKQDFLRSLNNALRDMNGECKEHEVYQCGNKCMPVGELCNGIALCDNGEDESMCSEYLSKKKILHTPSLIIRMSLGMQNCAEEYTLAASS